MKGKLIILFFIVIAIAITILSIKVREPYSGLDEVDELSQNVNAQNIDQPDNEIAVNLFYYNYLADSAINEAIPCSPDAVKSLPRKITKSNNYIEDTLNLLIKGDISKDEKSFGYITEFPDNGLALIGSTLSEEGELKLEFDDRNGFLSGGSCRVGLLYSQIEKTALQFIEVNKVTFVQDEIFQP